MEAVNGWKVAMDCGKWVDSVVLTVVNGWTVVVKG